MIETAVEEAKGRETMLRRVAARALWLTKGAALFGGAVVTLALVLGVTSMALGANGQPFILGQNNGATDITRLTGNVQGPAMQVVNTDPDPDDTALNLTVQPGEAPMRVTSDTKVGNLNADKLDGLDSGAFVRNDVYKAESLVDAGIQKADGTFVKTQGCEGNDVLLNGGPANVNASSDLLESFPAPASTNTWQARINTNGSADNYSVVVLCARQ